MKMRPGRTLAAAATLLATLSAPAFAADWPAERAKLVEAAEKEGKLVLFALPNPRTRGYVLDEWKKAFPKITIDVSVFPQPQFIARVRTERSVGKHLWDVAFSGHPAGYALAKDGALDPVPPELVDPDVNRPEIWGGWDNAFVDNQNKYVLATSAYLSSLNFDAQHVSPEKVKRLGYKVLLEPELKGKIAWDEPTTPGAGMSASFFIRDRLGDDGLKTLIQDKRVFFLAQQNQVVEAIAHGKAWIGIGPPVKMMMETFTKAGVKTDMRMMGRTPEEATMSHGGQTLYVFKDRPHPNATRLFVNWVLSKEIQHGMAELLGQGSRRADVPHVDPDTTPLPGAAYDAPQRESYVPKIEAAVRLVRELRQQAK
jgi:iron(III) transport system substrate-binding protein